MNHTKLAAAIAIVLFGVGALPTTAIAPGASGDTVASCRQVVVDPNAASPGGLVSACLTSAIEGCAWDADGRWVCAVQYTLALRVEAPLSCGDAFSPATPGTPGNLFTCAGAWPSYVVRVVDAEVARPPSGTVSVAGNWVCARPSNACVEWTHEYPVPGPDPSTQQGTLSPIVLFVYNTVVGASPVQYLPDTIHIGDVFALVEELMTTRIGEASPAGVEGAAALLAVGAIA